MDQLQQLIDQAKNELCILELGLQQVNQKIAIYPRQFTGASILDYQTWNDGRRKLLIEQEEKEREIRYKKIEIESLLSQKQLNIF